MNTQSLPMWVIISLTIIFNGLWACLKVFQSNIDPQTVVLLNLFLGYLANQFHVNIVNSAVASAKAPQ